MAVVMIFVMAAMIELALAAPSAELLKVRSTVSKEHSMASADAGARDAFVFLNANYAVLNANLTSPTSGSIPSGGSIYVTQQTGAATAAGGAVKTTTNSALTQQNGLYPFPTFTSSNFVRFGDPVISRGEYAYRIAALGNHCFQVDVEGRAQGVSFGVSASGTPPKLSSKITVVFIDIIYPKQIPGTANVMDPNNLSSGGSIDIAADANSGGAGDVAITGADGSTGSSYTSAGLAIQNSTVSYTSATNNTVSGSPAIAGGTSGNAPSQTQWDNITAIVNQAATLTNPTTPSSNGTATNPMIYTATYGTGSGQITSFSDKGIGLYYMKILAGSTVNNTILTVNGSPGSTGGVLILDIGDSTSVTPVTFSNSASNGLIQGDGQHPWEGTIIFYQRGPLVITTTTSTTVGGVTTVTPTLNLFYQNGNQADGLQFNSTNIAAAMALVQPNLHVAAYVVSQ